MQNTRGLLRVLNSITPSPEFVIACRDGFSNFDLGKTTVPLSKAVNSIIAKDMDKCIDEMVSMYCEMGMFLRKRTEIKAWEEASISEAYISYSMAKIMRDGMNCFRVTRPLFEKMFLTDIKIPYSEIRFPYDSFAIEFPNDSFKARVNYRETDDFSDVSVVSVVKSDNNILITLITPSRDKKSIEEVLYGITMAVSPSENKDGFNISIPVKKDSSVMLRRVRNERLKYAKKFLGPILGIISYISMDSGICKKYPPETKKLMKRAKNMSLSPLEREKAIKRLEELRLLGSTYIVGTNVTIDKNLKKIAQEEIGGKRTIDTASYVRGHIRNQACGPKRSERKMIWIEPHWRGLEASKVSQKTYTVK